MTPEDTSPVQPSHSRRRYCRVPRQVLRSANVWIRPRRPLGENPLTLTSSRLVEKVPAHRNARFPASASALGPLSLLVSSQGGWSGRRWAGEPGLTLGQKRVRRVVRVGGLSGGFLKYTPLGVCREPPRWTDRRTGSCSVPGRHTRLPPRLASW